MCYHQINYKTLQQEIIWFILKSKSGRDRIDTADYVKKKVANENSKIIVAAARFLLWL